MRLRFILIFGNKLIHSYNHDFNYHPICNTEQYIAQYIRMTGWRIKKILTTIYETAEKTGVDYVEMGMQRVWIAMGGKKRDSVLLTD